MTFPQVPQFSEEAYPEESGSASLNLEEQGGTDFHSSPNYGLTDTKSQVTHILNKAVLLKPDYDIYLDRLNIPKEKRKQFIADLTTIATRCVDTYLTERDKN